MSPVVVQQSNASVSVSEPSAINVSVSGGNNNLTTASAPDGVITIAQAGPQGPQGPTGSTGATGAQGPQGNTGSTGQTGATGPQGAQGSTGQAGPQGAQGTQGAQGIQGIQGSIGPQGVPGSSHATFVFTQNQASATWQITHNLGAFPSVAIVDSANTVVYGEIDYIDNNSLTVSFVAAFGGKAYLN